MEHWTEAKRLAPHMPVLDADIGKAWLQLKDDTARADVFPIGVRERSRENSDDLSGLDEAMSLNGVRRKTVRCTRPLSGLTEGPSLATMPASLVYQLALTRAEAGEYDAALSLFKGRFFPSEEGGVSAAQVLFEIELMKASAEATAGDVRRRKSFSPSRNPDWR